MDPLGSGAIVLVRSWCEIIRVSIALRHRGSQNHRNRNTLVWCDARNDRNRNILVWCGARNHKNRNILVRRGARNHRNCNVLGRCGAQNYRNYITFQTQGFKSNEFL